MGYEAATKRSRGVETVGEIPIPLMLRSRCGVAMVTRCSQFAVDAVPLSSRKRLGLKKGVATVSERLRYGDASVGFTPDGLLQNLMAG
jgi:hypothetical protein